MGLFDFLGAPNPTGDGDDEGAQEVPPGFVDVSHILLDDDEAAEALLARLAAGEVSFADAAMQSSRCPSRSSRGRLGAFRSLARILFLPYEGKFEACRPFE